jgi:hypothetical protein
MEKVTRVISNNLSNITTKRLYSDEGSDFSHRHLVIQIYSDSFVMSLPVADVTLSSNGLG